MTNSIARLSFSTLKLAITYFSVINKLCYRPTYTLYYNPNFPKTWAFDICQSGQLNIRNQSEKEAEMPKAEKKARMQRHLLKYCHLW